MLYPRKFGYPLWTPEPNEFAPLEYRLEGVRVGDVGFITSSGDFEFLHNTTWSSDHPIYEGWRKLPDDFQSFELNPTYYSHHTNGITTNQCIGSIGTRVYGGEAYFRAQHPHVGLHLSSQLAEGAVLLLPRGASKTDYIGTKPLRDWAMKHAKSWYHHLQNHYTDVWNGSLYLITGFHKTNCY
ncbi:hypothetical protein K435DRAFT_739112, partial [Dendrothele bispora CBS 962.96]